MLVGGDDISNDVITLGTCFSNVCYTSARFLFALSGGNPDSSVDGEPKGNWRWNSNFRDVVASSPSFSRPPPEHPGELARRLSLTLYSSILPQVINPYA